MMTPAVQATVHVHSRGGTAMPLPELFHEPEEAGHCPIQEGILEHLATCMHGMD